MLRTFASAGALLLASLGAAADDPDRCLAAAVRSAPDSLTVGELLQLCEGRDDAAAADDAQGQGSRLDQRMALERYTRENPFVLTTHRPNYILPAMWIRDPGQAISDDVDDDLDDVEIQFQLSLKVLLIENLYRGHGLLSVAYTNRSFWQAYNRGISAAFRETNHEPELILTFENGRRLLGFRNPANQLIFNHQSNGNYGERSRSWNRLMLQVILEKDDFVLTFKPWYRIPEGAKSGPDDPTGDDNPDIERYLGHFELNGAWARRGQLYSVMLRNNLRSGDNYGAIELSWTFPLSRRIRGVVKAFHGHGESLISYNQRTTSIGAGFLISDWL